MNITIEQCRAAAVALDDMDDFARMAVSVNASGAREVLERFIAEVSANVQPTVADQWKSATLHELIVAGIFTAEHEINPHKAVRDAIAWNCQVALDPAVSSDAQALVDRGRAEAEAEAHQHTSDSACLHDETELLGSIWTRCMQCGKMWDGGRTITKWHDRANALLTITEKRPIRMGSK